jgi:hypothetical protein
VKSDRMSLASGSTYSSSKTASRIVSEVVGITGRDKDEAEALTNDWRLVSGAIVPSRFAVYRNITPQV